MKSVSKLALRALSSRAFPFFLFRSMHLKTYSMKLMFVIETKAKVLQFSQQPPGQQASPSSKKAALTHSLFSMHQSFKGQPWVACVQLSKSAFEILFKTFSYANARCRWAKGMNMKIPEVPSSASGTNKMAFQHTYTHVQLVCLENRGKQRLLGMRSCLGGPVIPTKAGDGVWTLSWCFMTAACRKAARGSRLPASSQ